MCGAPKTSTSSSSSLSRLVRMVSCSRCRRHRRCTLPCCCTMYNIQLQLPFATCSFNFAFVLFRPVAISSVPYRCFAFKSVEEVVERSVQLRCVRSIFHDFHFCLSWVLKFYFIPDVRQAEQRYIRVWSVVWVRSNGIVLIKSNTACCT